MISLIFKKEFLVIRISEAVQYKGGRASLQGLRDLLSRAPQFWHCGPRSRAPTIDFFLRPKVCVPALPRTKCYFALLFRVLTKKICTKFCPGHTPFLQPKASASLLRQERATVAVLFGKFCAKTCPAPHPTHYDDKHSTCYSHCCVTCKLSTIKSIN